MLRQLPALKRRSPLKAGTALGATLVVAPALYPQSGDSVARARHVAVMVDAIWGTRPSPDITPLLSQVNKLTLPSWMAGIDLMNDGRAFLQYVVSLRGLSCAILGSTKWII